MTQNKRIMRKYLHMEMITHWHSPETQQLSEILHSKDRRKIQAHHSIYPKQPLLVL